jgi:hypothetical protein
MLRMIRLINLAGGLVKQSLQQTVDTLLADYGIEAQVAVQLTRPKVKEQGSPCSS